MATRMGLCLITVKLETLNWEHINNLFYSLLNWECNNFYVTH